MKKCIGTKGLPCCHYTTTVYCSNCLNETIKECKADNCYYIAHGEYDYCQEHSCEICETAYADKPKDRFAQQLCEACEEVEGERQFEEQTNAYDDMPRGELGHANRLLTSNNTDY